MNDFTKEELKVLRASISTTEINNSGIYGDKSTHQTARELYNKIQSMIDNYCEPHKPLSYLNDEGYLYVQCINCQLVLWHEKD